MLIRIITAKINTNPQTHQDERLAIIHEIAAITIEPKNKNKIPVFRGPRDENKIS